MTERAGVLVVDDHPVIRRGYEALINAQDGLRTIGAVGTAAEAIAALEAGGVRVVLCDLSMPDVSGLTLVRDIHEKFPDVRLLVVSMHDELLYAERVLRAGADGYLSKEAAPDVLVDAVRRVLSGESVLSESERARLEGRLDATGIPASPMDRLSDRELEVFELTGQGHGTRKVADMLRISVKTVETHKANIRNKLNLADAGELLRSAVAWLGETGG
jgi:DNA-binding NarL/FixJ family response regulator